MKNKSNRNSGTSNNDGQGNRIFNSNNVVFTTIAMKIILPDVKEINESIKIGNDDSMKASKIGGELNQWRKTHSDEKMM
jgi:hypothetical protein